jgi:hypothetical protein
VVSWRSVVGGEVGHDETTVLVTTGAPSCAAARAPFIPSDVRYYSRATVAAEKGLDWR